MKQCNKTQRHTPPVDYVVALRTIGLRTYPDKIETKSQLSLSKKIRTNLNMFQITDSYGMQTPQSIKQLQIH